MVWFLGVVLLVFGGFDFCGRKVRKVRRNAVDVHDAADVFLYRDASIAPLLYMRRRIKAVMDVLGAMIRDGVSLARSVELTCQWGRILAIGPLHPVTFGDLDMVRGVGIGEFHRIVSDLHRRLSDFIHEVVVHRRDEAVRGWRNWVRKDPLIHPKKWLRPDLIPPSPCLQCDAHLTPGGFGVLSDPDKIDEEFRKAWLPYFCRSGQRETSLEEFSFEVDGWLPLLPVVNLPTAGSLDGWGWKELKVLPVSWFDQLARILTLVEDNGVWPDGLLDAYITMIPKTDGDATPLGQRPLSLLPVVYRIWASSRMVQLEGWFKSWVPDSVVVVVGLLKLGILLLWILRKFFQVLLIPMFTFLLLMSLRALILLIGVFLMLFLVVLGCLAGFVMLTLSIMLMFAYGLNLQQALVSPGLVIVVFPRVAR